MDREKAAVLGISVSEIFTTLQANLGSLYINDFNLHGKVYRVIIQAEARNRDTIDDIRSIYIRSDQNEMVPMSTLVDIKPILGPLAINRYNQFKSASLQGSPAVGRSTGEAILALEEVAQTALPDGYGIEWTGTSQQEQEAADFVLIIFTMAILFAYLFLVAVQEIYIPIASLENVLLLQAHHSLSPAHQCALDR